MTDYANLDAFVHSDDFATIAMTPDQLEMLRTILDIAREDETDGDEEREQIAAFAEALHEIIADALAQASS
jgi:hypothetical protein